MDANIIDYTKAAVFVAAGLSMAIATIGPAFGLGMIGQSACENVGKYPESSSKIRTTMLLAMALVEACAVYALIISLLIITKLS